MDSLVNHDAEQPPRKRLATESSTNSNVTNAGSKQATQSGRARFLRELEQCASDDEDETAAVARSTNQPTTSSILSGSALARRLTAARPVVDTATTSADFFFDQSTPAHAINGNGDSSDANGQPPKGSFTSRVGLQLLHRMHADTTTTSTSASAQSSETAEVNPQLSSSSSPPPPPTSTASPVFSSATGFEVVHAYVPLSTGGFLSTASAGEDAMEGHHVRVGDILTLKKARAGSSTSASTAANMSHAHPSATSSPTSRGAAAAASFTAASTVDTASVEAVAQRSMGRFKAASTFSSEEQNFGRRLSPDMVRLLFEVTRVDRQGRTVEGLMLDHTRAKFSFAEIRPAGYVERRMYAQWKADPSSRPVTTMLHSDVSSLLTASPPSSLSASPVGSTTSPLLSKSTERNSGTDATATTTEWWVIPRLLVRLSTQAAGDWYGKKCVVKMVKRAESRIRLTEWRSEEENARAVGSRSKTDADVSSSIGAAAPETRELIGVEGLETVVPKKGGRALIVLGPRKGEMCTVRTRVRGPAGDLTGVEVEMQRTKEVVTLQADELCALAR